MIKQSYNLQALQVAMYKQAGWGDDIVNWGKKAVGKVGAGLQSAGQVINKVKTAIGHGVDRVAGVATALPSAVGAGTGALFRGQGLGGAVRAAGNNFQNSVTKGITAANPVAGKIGDAVGKVGLAEGNIMQGAGKALQRWAGGGQQAPAPAGQPAPKPAQTPAAPASNTPPAPTPAPKGALTAGGNANITSNGVGAFPTFQTKPAPAPAPTGALTTGGNAGITGSAPTGPLNQGFPGGQQGGAPGTISNPFGQPSQAPAQTPAPSPNLSAITQAQMKQYAGQTGASNMNSEMDRWKTWQAMQGNTNASNADYRAWKRGQ